MKAGLLLSLFLPVVGLCQSPLRDYTEHAARNWPTFSLSLLGGFADGTADALKHHYNQTVFPQSGPKRQWYDPAVSWENKYANWPTDQRAAFFGAKTWLVWTTDAWHMAKTVRNKAIQGQVFVYRAERQHEKRRWWWPVADFALSSLTFSLGWHIADNILVR